MKFQPIKTTFIFISIVLTLVCILMMSTWWTTIQLGDSYIAATRVVEEQLTANYGAEAKNAIELFERNYLSLESHQNPQLMLALTTSLLAEQIAAYTPNDEPYWLVATGATVEQVRVYEYSPSRLKTTGCVTTPLIKTTAKGEFISTLAPFTKCMVYVFLKEEGEEQWKLAAYFNLRDRRDWDWDYISPDLKAVIGELPSPLCNDPLLC